jgi:hypothetical protein
MKKKKFIILFLLLFSFNFFVVPYSALASGFTEAEKPKLTKMLRAIGEKIGISWTKLSLGAAVGYVGAKIAEGDGKIGGWWENFGSVPDTIQPDEGDIHYTLNPADFLGGVSAIKDADQSLVDGNTVSSWGTQCRPDIMTHDGINLNGGHWVKFLTAGVDFLYTWTDDNGFLVSTNGYGISGYNLGTIVIYRLYTAGYYKNSIQDAYNNFNTGDATNISSSDTLYSRSDKTGPNVPTKVPNYCPTFLVEGSNINSSFVDNRIFNDIDNTTYTNNVTNNFPVKVTAGTVLDDVENPWNPVDETFPDILEPPDTSAPQDITNLTEVHTNVSVDLTWGVPNSEDVAFTRVYRDGDLITDNNSSTNYHEDGLEVGSSHTYKITAVDAIGNESVGVSITVNLSDEPVDAPAGSSWWKWLLKPLAAIGDFFKNILSFLLSLVVPSSGFFQGMFDDSFADFNAKMPVIDQLSTFFTSVKSVATEGTIPKFEMTMPPSFGGGTFNIIDFKLFTDYRTLILNIIRFISWFVFLKRLYGRIPKMIY